MEEKSISKMLNIYCNDSIMLLLCHIPPTIRIAGQLYELDNDFLLNKLLDTDCMLQSVLYIESTQDFF